MEQCCRSYFNNCDGLTPCFEYLYVRIPTDYSGGEICLKIQKIDQPNGPELKLFATPTSGWALVQPDNLPDKFFNPFSKYRVEFRDANGNLLIEFTAKDGKKYQGIDFFFANNPDPINTINLNAMDNSFYD